MGAGERETLGRQSGASAELLACGDADLKPPEGGEGWTRGRGRVSRSMSCSDEALSSGSVFLRSVSSGICISQISVSRDLHS